MVLIQNNYLSLLQSFIMKIRSCFGRSLVLEDCVHPSRCCNVDNEMSRSCCSRSTIKGLMSAEYFKVEWKDVSTPGYGAGFIVLKGCFAPCAYPFLTPLLYPICFITMLTFVIPISISRLLVNFRVSSSTS